MANLPESYHLPSYSSKRREKAATAEYFTTTQKLLSTVSKKILEVRFSVGSCAEVRIIPQGRVDIILLGVFCTRYFFFASHGETK